MIQGGSVTLRSLPYTSTRLHSGLLWEGPSIRMQTREGGREEQAGDCLPGTRVPALSEGEAPAGLRLWMALYLQHLLW